MFSARLRPSSGFTLIETISVLMVTGIIVGGIWLGYATANAARKSTLGEQQIADLLQVTRNYLLTANPNKCQTTDYGTGCPAAGNDITLQLIQRNLLPESVAKQKTSGTDYISTIYGKASIRAYHSSVNFYNSGPFLGMVFADPIDRKTCTDFVNTWAGSPDKVIRSGLIGIRFNPNNARITNVNSNGAGGPDQNLIAAATGGSLNSKTIQNNCNNPRVSLFFRQNP